MRKEKYLRQVTEVWEDVHVPKAIDGNDRAVCWSLLNVEEWVPEFITVSMQEVYGTLRWWADKKSLLRFVHYHLETLNTFITITKVDMKQIQNAKLENRLK